MDKIATLVGYVFIVVGTAYLVLGLSLALFVHWILNPSRKSLLTRPEGEKER